ncbi:hypothetical protein [Streptomyces sp. NBC_01296]|uniref:hypothetical protein n=1 Tax=Streptomyces sp. NBC_01296 TaxID=2903816 RepID=UPI002E0D26B8|nr:hypothetical protein OG299_24505 [Streptomyces sp. NBC_01296]WSW59941.1 hypothetical protein OG513_15855 [Streptomyces sp. NBC_00998]
MAEEQAPGGLAGLGGMTTGVADAIRAQAASQAKAAALKVEYDTLSGYQNMVKDLLDDLTGSNADHKKLANDTLPAGKLGTGFPEADALFKSYGTVITELQKLSKGLAEQIEGLGIAILTAGKGYGGVDDETQRRMVAIAKQAEAHYVRERDPYPEEQRKLAASQHPGPATPGTGGNAKGGTY